MSSRRFGPDYPAFLAGGGVRLVLDRESPWVRVYRHPTKKKCRIISRFMDGSASITLDELRLGWPSWTDRVRHDFCQNCSWLHPQPDFPDMLRFVLKEGTWQHWSEIALSVASAFPQDEAMEYLRRALERTPAKHAANVVQAVAVTKHPSALPVIKAFFDALWQDARLWDDDPFTNWCAFTATCCIQHLLQLGAHPTDFEDAVRALAAHPCEGNRSTCGRYLRANYPWLP